MPSTTEELEARQAKRAALKASRRQKHEARARLRAQHEERAAAGGSSLASSSARDASATKLEWGEAEQARFLARSIYSEKAAQLARPGLADDLARVDETELGDALLCPICTEPLCHAVGGECGHVFCEECLLQSALKSEKEFFGSLCPLCRAPWELASLVRHGAEPRRLALPPLPPQVLVASISLAKVALPPGSRYSHEVGHRGGGHLFRTRQRR